jgi:hypothetical protein
LLSTNNEPVGKIMRVQRASSDSKFVRGQGEFSLLAGLVGGFIPKGLYSGGFIPV